MVLAVHDICTGSIWQRCQFSPVQSGYPDNTWIRNLAEKRTRNRHDSARALRCSVVSQSVHAEDGLTAPHVCTFLVVPSACDSGDDQAFPLRSAPSAAGLDAVPQEGFWDGESGYGGTRIGEILAPPSLCARCAGTKLLSEEVLDFSLVAWQLSHLMISVSCPV